MGVSPFRIARQKMIESQLIPGNIRDEAVLEAMADVSRELFVPEHLQGSAYVDEDIPVAKGRYLLAPLSFAQMLEWAEIKSDSAVLDVGCASGYSSAVLCRIAAKVVALEEQMDLAEHARQELTRQNCHNSEVITGPLAPGYPASGPYDVIIVNGAVEVVPESLTDQLAEDGRLIAVRREAAPAQGIAGLGKLVLYRKEDGKCYPKVLADAAVPSLPGFEEKRDFVF